VRYARVDDPAYSAPLLIRLPALLLLGAGGLAVAWAFEAGLRDAMWSVSTGIGACIAAAVYEVGRPARLSADEAVELEGQWQEFGASQDPFMPSKEFSLHGGQALYVWQA
jgi:hypothetical protein